MNYLLNLITKEYGVLHVPNLKERVLWYFTVGTISRKGHSWALAASIQLAEDSWRRYDGVDIVYRGDLFLWRRLR